VRNKTKEGLTSIYCSLVAGGGDNAPTHAPSSECKSNKCLYLDGTNYLQMPSHNFGQYPGLTISLWFKDNADTKKFERIFAIANGAGDGEMHIKRKDDYDHLEFTVSNSAGYSSNDRALLATTFVTGVWTHIVWTLSKRTATTAYWSIYINGVEQSFVCTNSLTRYVIHSVV
jgi:hypothetical protein